jgi:protein SCO1/2
MACAQLIVLGLLLIWTVGCTAATKDHLVVRPDEDPAGFSGAVLPQPYRMPDTTLADTSGRPYNLTTTPSAPVILMFFGYTNCPDVCLSVLSDVASALSRLSPGAREQVQLIFVTTDPARDSGPVVRRYLDRIDPRFTGLTGDLATVKMVAEQVGVDIDGRKKLPGGGYEVGHSAQVIGFDKERRGVVLWTPSTPISELKSDFELLVAQQQ